MKTIYCIAFLLSFNGVAVFGQKDSSKIFEDSKGTWNYPVSKCYEVFAHSGGLDSGDIGKGASFFTDSVCGVNAVFGGRVETIMKDDNYTVMIEYGKYFILYAGLTRPILKRGDIVKAGQIIAYPTKDGEGKYCVDIILFTKETLIDIFPWFRKQNLLTK